MPHPTVQIATFRALEENGPGVVMARDGQSIVWPVAKSGGRYVTQCALLVAFISLAFAGWGLDAEVPIRDDAPSGERADAKKTVSPLENLLPFPHRERRAFSQSEALERNELLMDEEPS